MDYKEALAYLDSIGYFGSKPGLERIGALLEKLGNPHKGMKFVHIAGTNGKGSCAAMAASILKAAGYKTGLYTSPYLYRFNERMQVGGREIPDEALAEILTRLKPLAEAMEDHPTEFELMTAAALLWYKEEACDVVVLEVGLGGRFDATNIIDAPEAAVIMNIGLDHTAILGDTVEQIAFEKAGIIKKGTDAVLYQQSEAVTGAAAYRGLFTDSAGVRLDLRAELYLSGKPLCPAAAGGAPAQKRRHRAGAGGSFARARLEAGAERRGARALRRPLARQV